MIVTITLNPAIDKRLHVAELQLGRVHRTVSQESTAGGKGLNVTRVILQLEEEVLATGMLGGMNGEWIKQRLNTDGIRHDFLAISGETRVCLNIIDDKNGTSTEILEHGPCITELEATSMMLKIRELAAPGVWMQMSGSLPAGVPDDFYGLLVREAQKRGAKVLLDTSGAALKGGLKGAPFLIKPNADEITQLTGESNFQEASFRRLVERLAEQGVHNVIVSLGAEGCVAAFEGSFFRVRAPRIQAVNSVGSGDSFMAGLAIALQRGFSSAKALRLATAVGAANAMTHGTGQVYREDVKRLQAEVLIEQYD